MSASFCTSFPAILKQDIRHIHSGLPMSDVRFQKALERGRTVKYERIPFEEPSNKGHEALLRKKDKEFIEEYDTSIPKAPAFKQVPSGDVGKIVSRLYYESKATRDMLRSKNEKERDRGLEMEILDDKYRRLPELSEQIGDRLYKHSTACSMTRARAPVKTPL